MRVLYFDIDGVLLSYEDIQRPLLTGGTLQARLMELGFDCLTCVSGWSDLLNAPLLKRSSEQQKMSIHAMLKDIFPDRWWFLSKLVLAYDADQRCQHIDLESDWFYLDDWADKYFVEHWGENLYRKEFGRRILLVNPHGDGSDILEWFDQAVSPLCHQKSLRNEQYGNLNG